MMCRETGIDMNGNVISPGIIDLFGEDVMLKG